MKAQDWLDLLFVNIGNHLDMDAICLWVLTFSDFCENQARNESRSVPDRYIQYNSLTPTAKPKSKLQRQGASK